MSKYHATAKTESSTIGMMSGETQNPITNLHAFTRFRIVATGGMSPVVMRFNDLLEKPEPRKPYASLDGLTSQLSRGAHGPCAVGSS